MKTQIIFTALIATSATTMARCQMEPAKRFNPAEFLVEAEGACDFTYNGVSYEDKDFSLENEILAIGTFKNILENNTKSTDHFTVNVVGKKDCIMWCVNKEYNYDFYSDGYIEAIPAYKGSNDSEGKHYFYKIADKTKAQALFDTVTTKINEYGAELNAEKEKYEAAINQFDLNYFLEDMYSSEAVITFGFNSEERNGYKTSCVLKDENKTLRDLIKSTTFSEVERSAVSRYEKVNMLYIEKPRNNEELKLGYEFSLDETNRCAILSSLLLDKFNRIYSKDYYFNVSREDIQKIFNQAFAERDADRETPPLVEE